MEESESDPIPASTDSQDRTLVALTPADMPAAQAEIAAWCTRKIAAVRAEQADLEANLELATASGWRHASVVATLNRTAKRVVYYEKLKAAVEAGYVIVPNFPIDLFAVRVQRGKQREATAGYSYNLKYKTANPELLPAGEGRYVGNELLVRDESYNRTKADGTTEHVRLFASDDYDAVDFPVTVVKPAILEATHRAMALKLFDQIGIVRNQSGRDPIVVGQLVDPRGNRRVATFFVAWWLDTATL